MLTKKYNNIKNNLKKAMIKMAQENGATQVKWTTPEGTQITCSIGHVAEIEKQKVKEFDEEYLKNNYPHIYDECCIEKERSVIIKNATSDTLRITLSKNKGGEE